MSLSSMQESMLTDCGLPGVRYIPYGVHMCHFFRTREELVAALVPYFAAGLRRNERCIWVTVAPLSAAEALMELRRAGFDADRALAAGALAVGDYDDWYMIDGELKGSELVDVWLAEEERALAAGYSGLRITGNTSFLRPSDWERFMDYEALVERAFRHRRIVTLCSYCLDACGASEMLDVMHRHGCTLDRPDQGWQIVIGDPA